MLLRELPAVTPAAVVIVLLVCVLVPLPAALVDLLLSLDLAAAVLLVVAVVQVRRVADLLGFPLLVLVLTLTRLALNVSTTRLILADADAGRVVDAFASLVVRDDMIIGAVMFAVITTIQYLVIARGAERVAEVAARFALDAMPGQQQAIDADLRAGAIGPRDAEARRTALAERADLFGRMDGVLRMIKYDAVVGLLITTTNFVGGLTIGVVRGGHDLVSGAAVYGRLAIGDGLTAQIPALLVALAAALLVARVDRGDLPAPGLMGPASWLEPGMVVAPAVLLGGLALVPGMPTLAFAATACGLLGLASILAHGRRRARSDTQIQIRLGSALIAIRPSSVELELLRERCEETLAIPLPTLALAEDPGRVLAADELELRQGGRVLARVRVAPGPAGPAPQQVLLAVFRALMDSADRFVTLAAIELAVARCRAAEPETVRQATRAVETLDLLAIVRGFVRERIAAPSMDALLGALAERRVFHDLGERQRWPEHAREALADHWVRDLCDCVAEVGEPCWLRPTVDLEEVVRAGAVAEDARVRLRFSETERAQLRARFRQLAGGRPAIIVCTGPARPALAAALAGAKPPLPVVAIGELIASGLELPPTTIAVDLG